MNKILVADFDGTLYTSKVSLKKNKEKINEFVKKGNTVIIATGRALHSIKKYQEVLDMDFEYMICNDGGFIYDKNLNLLKRNTIDKKLIIEVVDYLKEEKNCENLIIDDGENFHNEIVDNVCFIGVEITTLKEAEKIKYYINQKYKNELYAYLSYNKNASYLSHSWINITDKNTNKACALKGLVKNNKYDPNNLYVIGDNTNDFKMIKEYNGYAMENGSEDILEICKKKYKEVYNLIEEIEKEAILK